LLKEKDSAMNVTIEIPDDVATALKAQAQAQGLTVEGWFQRIATDHVPLGSIAHLQKTDPQEWARQFRAWADGHDLNTPVLSDDAMSRESIYPDRG